MKAGCLLNNVQWTSVNMFAFCIQAVGLRTKVSSNVPDNVRSWEFWNSLNRFIRSSSDPEEVQRFRTKYAKTMQILVKFIECTEIFETLLCFRLNENKFVFEESASVKLTIWTGWLLANSKSEKLLGINRESERLPESHKLQSQPSTELSRGNLETANF